MVAIIIVAAVFVYMYVHGKNKRKRLNDEAYREAERRRMRDDRRG